MEGTSDVNYVAFEQYTCIGASKSLTQFSGGQLIALDNSTLLVRELVYDGLGPDAFFLAGEQLLYI